MTFIAVWAWKNTFRHIFNGLDLCHMGDKIADNSTNKIIYDRLLCAPKGKLCVPIGRKGTLWYSMQNFAHDTVSPARSNVQAGWTRGYGLQDCKQKSKRMAQPSVGIECRSKISWSMPRLASRLIFPEHPGEKSATILGRYAIGHATYQVVTVTNWVLFSSWC